MTSSIKWFVRAIDAVADERDHRDGPLFWHERTRRATRPASRALGRQHHATHVIAGRFLDRAHPLSTPDPAEWMTGVLAQERDRLRPLASVSRRSVMVEDSVGRFLRL